MSELPSLAVVISTYNAPNFLRLTLEGYRWQSDLNFSIYIADDGSEAETKTLIEGFQANFPVPIRHIWQQDKGFRKAHIHNQTICQISETRTLLTDGDCIPLPGLVQAHRKLSRQDAFISGSRILISQKLTRKLCLQPYFDSGCSSLWWLQQRLTGNINRLLPLLISPRLSGVSDQLEGIRGCHLSCPTEVLIHINGFDESFEGWGREDSDLAARMLHAGLQRRNLLGLPVLHLWHQENSRQRLDENDTMLQACLDEHRIKAVQGLQQLRGETDA
jgi:GT2 family glycosyltransferase